MAFKKNWQTEGKKAKQQIKIENHFSICDFTLNYKTKFENQVSLFPTASSLNFLVV